MKFGVITDIHNNFIALKTVVDRLNQLKCDKIICCGDIIGIGPYPEETVQYMMQIPNLIAVRGNHEKYLLDGMPNEYPNEENMSVEEMKHHEWEHHLLSSESTAFLETLPYKKDITYEGLDISIVHYCMDYDGHYVNHKYKANPSAEDLTDMFDNIKSDIILYGHNHFSNICKTDKQLYINVGSLGCPAQNKNLARAGVLKIANGNAEIQQIDVKYDVQNIINAIDKINYPDADNIKKFFYGIW